MPQHRYLGLGDIHRIYNWEYADEAARTGASEFVPGDIGKLARQLDENSYWILTSTTPTWLQIGGGGGSGTVTATEGADGYLAFFTGAESIAGDNDLFWDRKNNQLGLGTTSPSNVIEIDDDKDYYRGIQITSYNGFGGTLHLRGAKGTKDAPTGLTQDYRMGHLLFYGYDGNSWENAARIVIDADETWSDSQRGSRIWIGTTNRGSTSISDNWIFQSDGSLWFYEQIGQRTPSGGWGSLYVKTDGKIYFKNDSSVEYDLTTGGGTPAGSDSQIQYNNGGSFGGAAQFYYDDVNNRVGIGTSGPDYPLHISGSDPDNMILKVESTPSNGRVFFQAMANGTALNLAKYANGRSGEHTASGLPYGGLGYLSNGSNILISSTDKIRFVSGGIMTLALSETGNIGIGTTLPHEKLTVNGRLALQSGSAPGAEHDVDGYGTIYVNQSDNKLYYQYYNTSPVDLTAGGGGGVTSAQGADGYIAFFTGPDAIAGDNDLFWNRENNQLVLGGNASALIYNSLNVVGRRTEAAEPYGAITTTTYFNGNDGSSIQLIHARGTEESPSALDSNDQMGQIQFFAYDGSGYSLGARIIGQTDGSISTGIVPGELRFYLTDTSGVNQYAFQMNYTGHLWLAETAYTNTPASGFGAIYVDNNGVLCFKNDSGVISYLSNRGSGSTNHIAIWSDTNTLTYDANDLYWDISNNRLGINTSSPQVEIHIYTSSPQIRLDNNSAGAKTWEIASYYQEDSLRFINITDNHSDLIIHGDGTVSVTSNLSIGGALINKDLSETFQVILQALDGYSGGGGTPAGSDGQVQYNNGGSFGGAAQLYYDDINDRVGLGLSSPSYPLHVYRNGSNPSVVIESASGSYDADVTVQSPKDSKIIAKTQADDPYLDCRIYAAGFGGSITTRWTAGIDNSASDYFKISYGGSPSSGTAAITIDPTNGHVGIGVDPAASAALYVNKDVDGARYMQIANWGSGTSVSAWTASVVSGTGTYIGAYGATNSATIGGQAAAGASVIHANPSTKMIVGTYSSAPFHLMTNNTHAMTIDTSQRVGIGLTSPVNKLDVEGGVAIGATYAGTDTAPTNGLIVEGKLGVGINNPSYKLDVRDDTNGALYGVVYNPNAGASAYSALAAGSSGGWAYMLGFSSAAGGTYGGQPTAGAAVCMSNYSTRFIFGSFDAAPVHFMTGNTHAATLSTDQNFGIGTDYPHERLTINGRMALQAGPAPGAAHDVDGYGTIYVDSSDNKLYYQYYNSSPALLAALASASARDGYLAFYDGNNNLAGDNNLIWDNEHHRLGLGVQPSTAIDMDTGETQPTITITGHGADGLGKLNLRGSGGTKDSPTATPDTYGISMIVFTGYDGNSYNYGSFLKVTAAGEWSDSNHGANVVLYTVPNGGTSGSANWIFGHNGAFLMKHIDTPTVMSSGYTGLYAKSDNKLYYRPYGGSETEIATSSDERLKKDIVTIENALEKVISMRGVTFNWIDENRSQDRQMGLIAQETEKAVPEVVWEDGIGYKNIKYDQLTGILVEAIKDLKKENDDLRARLETLENKIK